VRAASTPDWFAFIRPHLGAYRRAGFGDQTPLLEATSTDSGLQLNTLRRYVAAAELLEEAGIVDFGGYKPPPVAAVEVIARIAKRDPARGRVLLQEMQRGSRTVRSLQEELSATPSEPAAGRVPTMSRAKLEKLIETTWFAEENTERGGFVWISPNDWTGPFHLFSPAFVPFQ
jgi:hypothetical protein